MNLHHRLAWQRAAGRAVAMTAVWIAAAGAAVAQVPPPAAPDPDAPPVWDVQLGASFVGTSGNSETSSVGANLEAHQRWPVWIVDVVASAVRTSQNSIQTAEQYMGGARVRRSLNDRIAATSGIRLERDRLAGLDARSLVDGGLTYVLVKEPQWTLDGLSSVAWSREARVTGETLNETEGVLGVTSKYLLGAAGDTTQRFAFYPNFTTSTRYRSEAEITVQAAMNKHVALKLGFLWRYAHDPVPGFKQSDTTTTASIVLRMRSDKPAP
jgi:putative salt-induced outer membrane protein YdiY